MIRLEGKDAIQRHLDSLGEWGRADLVKSNKAKCKVLHVVQGCPSRQSVLGGEWVDRSPVEDDLEETGS